MLKGKVAVVTGSTSGIGLGIASALPAGRRYRPERLRRRRRDRKGSRRAGQSAWRTRRTTAPTCQGRGRARPDRQRGAPARSHRHPVNNAGIQHTAPIEDFPVEKWDAIIALNLSAVFHGTAAALPYMKKQGFGRIINIASAHGLVASAFKSAYVAAKHGVVGFTKVTALETAGQGITANAICPGWVRTRWSRSRSPRWPRRTAWIRKPPPANCSAKSSPRCNLSRRNSWAAPPSSASDAAAQITGTTISVDGGWTAR